MVPYNVLLTAYPIQGWHQMTTTLWVSHNIW